VFAYYFGEHLVGFYSYLRATASGAGFVTDFGSPWQKGTYYQSLLAVIAMCIAAATTWEIGRVVFEAMRGEAVLRRGWAGIRAAFARIARCFSSTFFSALLAQLLPRLIVLDVFWKLQPAFDRWALFHVDSSPLGWIYALLAWDLATWVYHFASHRVRLLWCLHSPHHASEDLTITTAWVHFFAEGWYTTLVQLAVLTMLGVPVPMLIVLQSFEVTWGTLIHVGERTLPTGRLGLLRYLIITPSYHRVHHARNPLYLDTNFCTLLPFWDWVFGTLQPLRDEVRLEYGVTRKIDVTNFFDFYFGELRLLYLDLKSARGWRETLGYLFKAPGWSPDNLEHTAAWSRQRFLEQQPQFRNWHWSAP
jgi:sterol desaturase/sphingolipid hydroxylase (fatty acid hydroxylase superfamily)